MGSPRKDARGKDLRSWQRKGQRGWFTLSILVAPGRFLGFLVSVTLTKLWKAADLGGKKSHYGRDQKEREREYRAEALQPRYNPPYRISPSGVWPKPPPPMLCNESSQISVPVTPTLA